MFNAWGTQTIQIQPPAPRAGLRGYCVDQKARLRWRLRPNIKNGLMRVLWVGDWVLDPPNRIINSNGVVYKLPEHRA